MSAFCDDDVVAFKDDVSIVCTVELTWSDVEQGSLTVDPECDSCYIHKSLPAKVRRSWFNDEELPPGYVIVKFMDKYDAVCLISETSLKLVDRALAIGDIVKRSSGHAESGTIISTSIFCDLQPVCSETSYKFTKLAQPRRHAPSHGPKAPKKRSSRDTLSFGFPVQGDVNLLATDPEHSLKASAQDLTHCYDYREEDFVIYQDWVGQAEEVINEVTVRLSNGSVVTIEEPEELVEPLYVPGSKPYELTQRLDRAGYYRLNHSGNAVSSNETLLFPAEPCYPGQRIETKKGNLRRGNWKFGAYDPTVQPQGIVVEVRCIELHVRWLYPNQSLALRNQGSPPTEILGLDEISSGQIIIYDRSRQPKASETPNASYGPDTTLGEFVRFKDLAGAAIKYGQHSTHLITDRTIPLEFNKSRKIMPYFHRIPRAATQGFDMNVLQVTSTSTKVMVRWQDWSITEEESVHLFPYLNVDEHDVWPGDRVSLVSEEGPTDVGSAGSIRLNKVGVVQTVNASARIAKVRWYESPEIQVDDHREWQSHGSLYGEISEEYSEIPLFDIAAHPAFASNRGDMAVILPTTDPHPQTTVSTARVSTWMRLSNLFPASVSASETQDVTDNSQNDAQEADWFGEIVDTLLDGRIIVRLGAANEVRDIVLPPERIVTFASDPAEDDSSYFTGEETDETRGSDDLFDANADVDSDISEELDQESVINISYEYEGEEPNSGEDEEMWATDDEDEGKSDQMTDNSHVPVNPSLPGPNAPPSGNIEIRIGNASEATLSFASYSTMPLSFCVLEASAPSDHRFHDQERPLTADLMRRIAKETKILKDSLPDGVFIRSWDTRLDLLRILIIGPYRTPYEFSPFVIDLHYGSSFPASPPDVFFYSWTNNMGRINPNLYEDGKICLSLLGTWDGDNKNEEWSSKNSTILQLVVSLMGLVLVKEPYFNEAGFDVLIGSSDSKLPSALYNEKAYVMSKGFVRKALATPPNGLEDIITWLYTFREGPRLLQRVVEDSKAVLPAEPSSPGQCDQAPSEASVGALSTAKLSAGAAVLLKRNLDWLQEILDVVDRAVDLHGRIDDMDET